MEYEVGIRLDRIERKLDEQTAMIKVILSAVESGMTPDEVNTVLAKLKDNLAALRSIQVPVEGPPAASPPKVPEERKS